MSNDDEQNIDADTFDGVEIAGATGSGDEFGDDYDDAGDVGNGNSSKTRSWSSFDATAGDEDVDHSDVDLEALAGEWRGCDESADTVTVSHDDEKIVDAGTPVSITHVRGELAERPGGGEATGDEAAKLWRLFDAPAEARDDETGAVNIDDDRTADELWSAARKAYTASNNPGIGKATARMRATRALEAETSWMDVKRSTQTDDPQDLWWHDEEAGRYVQNVTRVKNRMVAELDGEATATEVNHVKHFLQARNGVSDDAINAGDAEDTMLPFANGVMNISEVARSLDPETGIDVDEIELEDPSADQYWTYQIDTEWDPDGADVEGFDEWLSAICPDEHDRRVYAEFAGHAVHPGYPVDGFMMVRGPGGSGKSQAVEVIGHAIGEESVGRSKLHKIEGNRFETAQVVDKTVNLDKDLEGTKLDTMSKLKHLAAGEEMSCELKGVDAYKAINSATMIMAADNPPPFPDGDKKSLGRRLYSVEFPCEFVDNPDPDNKFELQHRPKIEVEDELRSSGRCKALMVRAVQGLAQLLATGRFSTPYTWEERIERYESHADPVADSVRTLMVRDPDGTIHGADYKAAYDRLAQVKNHPQKSQQSILQTAQRFVYTTMRKDRTRTFTPGRERDTVYHGMAWSDEAKEDYLPEDAHWAQMDAEYADYNDVEPEDETGGDVVDTVTLEDIKNTDVEDTGELSVKVKVHWLAGDKRPDYLTMKGTVRDDTDTIEIRSQGVMLQEDAEYVIEGAVHRSDRDGNAYLDLIPGLSEAVLVDDGTRDEGQETVEDVDSDDAGEVINDDETGDAGGELDPRDAVHSAVDELESTTDKGAPVEDVIDRVASEHGFEEDKIEHVMEKAEYAGRIYEPNSGHLRAT
jgi:Predicted ATPase